MARNISTFNLVRPIINQPFQFTQEALAFFSELSKAVNSTDANIRAVVAALIQNGFAINWTYNETAGTLTGDLQYNTTNLKITSDKINTIQDISTTSTPVFGGLTLTSLNGILKAVTGAVGVAVAGTDYVAPNASITGATKTKITYDSKGLVTGGADATTADIADSTNKRYVTDANLTVIGNTSGTNTGDQLTFKTIAVSGQSDVVADSTTDTLTLVAGTNITITTDATADSITINAVVGAGTTNLGYTASPTNGIVTSDTGTDATIPLADTTDAGLLSPSDKTKLNNTTNTNSGDETTATIKTKLGVATASVDGYLTSTDWNTFNNKEPAIASGTTAQYYRGDKTFQTLDTSVVPENTNLYYTDERVDDRVANLVIAGNGISVTYNDVANTLTIAAISPQYTGDLKWSGQLTNHGNWLLCNGTAYSKTTYAALWALRSANKGACTITIATPAVVTNTGHGLLSGDKIFLTTTGALPTGLSINTTYWITKVDANTFKVSTSYANYVAGTFVNTTGTQSGTHTLTWTADGVQDANNAYLPDKRNNTIAGASTTYGIGSFTGAATHTLVTGEIPSHRHSALAPDGDVGNASSQGWTPPGGGYISFRTSDRIGTDRTAIIGNTGGGGAHNNMQPTTFENCFIYAG